MRLVALAVGEEGEEDEEEEEEKEKKKGKEEEKKQIKDLTVKELGRYTGHHGLAMRPVATTAVWNRNRRPAYLIFFVSSPPPLLLLLLLLLLLPAWFLTIVADASPLHPIPPHKSEPPFSFFVRSLSIAKLFQFLCICLFWL